MGKLFTLVIIFFTGSVLLAQENIIDHPIKKGESVYSISRKYGVSMNAIFRLNPGSEDIIYAGRTLKVPTANPSTNNDSVITEDKITNYEVKRGETKSGLSRRFGVSIAMLEQQNPHIIRMLQAGHIINIDKSIREEAQPVNEGEHRVVKGETLWGISRRYGITLAQLTEANANQLSEFLQIGQVLTIPSKDYVVQNSGEYIVRRGDTKFALSKRFNMTIAELEAQNPHIVDMLMAGHVIDITKPSEDNTIAETQNEQVEEENQTEITEETTESTANTDTDENSEYVDYIIQPKETLYSLSKKAGMTINEFTTLNPKLTAAVNAGDIVKMPKEALNSTTGNDSNEVDENEEVVDIPNIAPNKNSALYNNFDLNKISGLYFYTPFSSEELRSSESRANMINSNAENQRFLDYFQGAQIAIDSAKTLGLNFEITLVKSNNVKQILEIESPYEDNALIVPFLDNTNLHPEIDSEQTISIIDVESNIISTEKDILVKTIPSKEIQKKKVLDYLSGKDAQVIVVSELDEAKNKSLIQQHIPTARFLKVDNAGVFKDNLKESLDKNRLNYVILDSDKTIIFLNTTTSLMSQLADYDIQLVLIDASLLPKQNEVSNMRYRILKLVFPAIVYPENNVSQSQFELAYQDLFDVEPSKEAMLGFNVTLDIILRLSQNTSFENTLQNKISEYSHIKFNYEKDSDKTYSNTSLYLLQYDSNNGIIVLKNR